MSESLPIDKLSRHLLYEDVAASIRQLIRDRALWGSYLPPEREMAELLGVNRGTLRKGLEVLDSQGVIGRRQGRGTLVLSRNGRRGARVLVASNMRLPARETYFAEITTGLTIGASDEAWNVVFHTSLRQPERWDALLRELERGELDGAILVSLTERSTVEEILRRWKGPAVLVDHHYSDLPLTSVVDDSRGGARAAAEHLLALGHRRIGYLGVSDPQTNPWRFEGYCQALRAAGLEADPRLVVPCHASVPEGRAAAEQLLSLPEPPTAIMAFDDTRAWGAWEAVEARGLAVGRDVAIVGYGDAAPPAGRAAELSTVHIDPHGMGQAAVEELNRLISGESAPGKLVELPAELVVRGSSREARPAPAAEGGR